MVVGLLGNESSDSNRFTLVTPKPENGVRLQATLGNQNPTCKHVGAVRRFCMCRQPVILIRFWIRWINIKQIVGFGLDFDRADSCWKKCG